MAHLAISCIRVNPAALSYKKHIEHDGTARREEPYRASRSHFLGIWIICRTSQASLRRVLCFSSHVTRDFLCRLKQDGFGWTYFFSYWPCKCGSEPGLDALAGVGDGDSCDSVWILTCNTYCDCGKSMHVPGLLT